MRNRGKILTPMIAASLLLIMPYRLMQAQELILEADTRVVIEDPLTGDVPLSVPVAVASFSDGTFVMKQGNDMELRLFNPDGDYQGSIGGRGRGPFEFRDISYLFIDSSDRLHVFDHYQAKLAVFDKTVGIEERSTPFAFRPFIRTIHALENGNYLIGMSDSDRPEAPRRGYQYFIIQPDFNTVVDSALVHRSNLHEEEPGSIPDLVMDGGPNTATSVLTRSGDLVVAPGLYTGRLLVFRSNNHFRIPEILRTRNYAVAYREYDGTLPESFDEALDLGVSGVSGPRGMALYFQFNDSKGLFRLSSGLIAHFAQEWDEKSGQSRLWLEVLDPDASQVAGITEITRLGDLRIRNHQREGKNHSVVDLGFLHLDADDNLYVRAYNRRYEPELHVIHLDVRIQR